ncbi:putative E3 ubiquitin-protein ligase UBR7 [Pollicipes pollicipes]|uniref:putative E3 ubiquitin-protein ligase UBR7 n=1 Tax=Pollicipes pollicipes TaxID=41117 RepID=UPI00188500D3|nr:putative E3 ubiquitin-protein ligase UBR7 [Pollicipes pollicipes]
MSEGASGSSSSIPPNEDSITMLDVLKEEEDLDDDAAAVLGNTDDKNCSYDQGYVKRQPLYACLTCSGKDQPAGVCLACSYHCHETHELVELYTKRNFRCDCGGGLQPDTTCRLTAKTGTNPENKYNQNYAGLYCTCRRPYPDAEDDTPDQMIQCVVCEDWYHGRHLGAPTPEDGDYAEVTCAECVQRLPYLRQYAGDSDMCVTASTECQDISQRAVQRSYHCHETHELVELYTKRNFRCDCGGGLQPDTTCRLTAKTGTNPENKYNQNYAGLYCTCRRPYPDAEDDTPDQMIQCVVCEDWYQRPGTCHRLQPTEATHLGAPTPEDGDYAEVTCAECVQRLPYLRQYAGDSDMCVTASTECQDHKPESSPKKGSPAGCKLKSMPRLEGKGSLFWKMGWRRHLCTCDACKALYAADGVEFLLDEDDSVAAYEARGRGAGGSYAQGMRALSSMDRLQQVEVAHEYNDLKSELMNYLKKFAENKKVVRKEDIQEFFTGMKSRKRQKTDVPHFCR